MNAKKEDRKTRYKMIASQHALPLFFQPYWLDAVADAEHWDVAIRTSEDGVPLGVWPYVIKRVRGLVKMNIMPLLTPYLGPWLFYPEEVDNAQKRFDFEAEVLPELVAQLPAVFLHQQKCHPRFSNWMPLHWQGFQQTTRYTYRIGPGSSTQDLFSPSLQQKIRRYQKRMDIQVSNDPALFYQINALSFTQQGRRIPYNQSFFLRLDEALKQRDQREISIIFDQAGGPLGALYLVRDSDTIYYLASGIDRTKQTSGVMTCLVARGIEKAMMQAKAFDFEGSMIQGIEKFFRPFGGILTPCHLITKGRNRWAEALKVGVTGRL